jgi:hypothetical protein
MFSLSTFVVGPAISGGGSDKPGIEQSGDHASHHQK